MAYNELDNSLFAPGQPIDSATLTQMNENTKSTQAFPKVAKFVVIHSSLPNDSRIRYQANSLEDKDGIGLSLVGNDKILLPAGEYYFDLPLKTHVSGAQYSKLHNDTLGSLISAKEIYAYSSTTDNGMNNGVIKEIFTLDQPCEISVFHRSSSANNYVYESHGTIMQLR